MAEHGGNENLRRLIGLALAATVVLIVARSTNASLDLETYKILLQFLLVTVVGGLVFLQFSNERAEREARNARVAALQELDRDLDKAYRAIKAVKRGMRARLLVRNTAEPRMSEADFTGWMDKLLSAQLDLERVRESIAIRHDVLDETRLARINTALRHASRYYNRVFQDYEAGRMSVVGGQRKLERKATYIRNFLLGDQENEVAAADMDILSGDTDLMDRWVALERLIEASKAKRNAWDNAEEEDRRAQRPLKYYAEVAVEAISLATDELRTAVRNALTAK